MIETVNEGHKKVYKKAGESPYAPELLATQVKHPEKVMFWGIISIKEPGRLHIVEGAMNSDQYLKVIDSRVIPQLMDWYGSLEDCVLQQDKAPCHSSKAVKQKLNDAGIKVLEWPGNSPDMNPIENVWAVLKRKIRENPPKTKNELIRKVLDMWVQG